MTSNLTRRWAYVCSIKRVQKDIRRVNLSAFRAFFSEILPFGADDNCKDVYASKSELKLGVATKNIRHQRYQPEMQRQHQFHPTPKNMKENSKEIES